MEGSLTSMIKLNNPNWAMWKSLMENFVTIKDLSNILDGEEVKPKNISNLEWKKMYKKTNFYNRQWIGIASHHHMAIETNVYVLWKKLE